MYSLFLKGMTNASIRYKLLEENKDLTTSVNLELSEGKEVES